MAFDIEGARKAGYTDAEIADHLASQNNFDIAAARKSGYTDKELLGHFASSVQAPDTRTTQEKLGLTLPQIGRSAALVGRGMFDAAIGIPGMFANAANELVDYAKNPRPISASDFNPFSGHPANDSPTEAINKRLDQFLPKDSGIGESALRMIPSIMLGSKIPMPGVSARPDPNALPAVATSADLEKQASRLPPLTAANRAASAASATAEGGGSTFGTVGEDASAGLTNAQARLAQTGKALGMELTPGQQSGSRALQQFEAKLESQPWTSGPFNTIKEGNSKALGRIAAKAIGEDGTELSSDVLGRAQTRLGNVFESVRDTRPIPVDPKDLVTRLQGINSDFDGLANINNHPVVQKFLDVISKDPTGEQLGSISSKLSRAINQQMTGANGDREMGLALGEVKDLVDDLVSGSLTGAEKSAYDTARQQYRNLMLITARANAVNTSSGKVSGPALAAALRAKDKTGFVFGKNNSDLYNAARFSEAYKSLFGDSGTATRSMTLNPVSLAANVGSRVYLSPVAGPAIRGMGSLFDSAGNFNQASPLMDLRSLPGGLAGLLTPK